MFAVADELMLVVISHNSDFVTTVALWVTTKASSFQGEGGEDTLMAIAYELQCALQ